MDNEFIVSRQLRIIRNKGISPLARLICLDIIEYERKLLDFSLTNSELSTRYNVDKLTISRAIAELKKARIIYARNSYKNYDGIRSKIKSFETKYECTWCGRKTIAPLEKHHFPISSKLGGKNTVSICCQCHKDFHYIENLRIVGVI